jgi:tetratricopeptide (TPR) repeat protein
MKLQRALIAVLVALVLAPSCSRDPKVRSRKYVEVGNKYLDKSKFKEASIMFRKAISVDTLNADAYYHLGLTELRMGQFIGSAREFHRTLDLQPKGAKGTAIPPFFMDARTHLADLYLMSYLASEAKPKLVFQELERLVQEFQQADPKSFQGFRIEGYLLLSQGKPKEALAKFEAANQVKPFQSDVVLALVQTLTLDGRFPEAEKLAGSLIQKEKNYIQIYAFLYRQYMIQHRLDDAENVLKMQMANNPKSSLPIIQLASHYHSQNRRPEMIATLNRLVSNSKDFPTGRLTVGDFYLRLREWDQASSQYQEGIRLEPKDKLVYQKRLVELMVQQDRKQDAGRYLAEILKANPKDFEAQAMHASLLLDTGSTKDLVMAISELQSLVPRTADNPNPVLRFQLGRAYWIKGDFAQAEVQFKEAVKIKPNYFPPRLALAQLELFRSNFALASQMATETLQFSPNNVPAKLIRARALAGMQKFEEARADLVVAQKLDPNSTDVLFQMGVLQSLERKYPDAEETFRKLYQKSDYRGLAGLTETYAAQKQYDRAIALLQTELAKSPTNSTIRSYLGNMAVRGGQYDLAIAQFKSLIDQDPKREDLYLRLGETYRRRNDLDQATECFRKARTLAPNDPIPHLELALLLEATGHKAEAKSVYEMTLKLRPDDPVALNNLAYIMAETGGDLDQALTLAQRAKQRLPQDSNVGDTLGWIYIKKNLSGSAVDVFRDLVAREPKNATIRYHFGMALLQKGDKLSAKKELQTALQNNPSKEEAAKIKELIAKIG